MLLNIYGSNYFPIALLNNDCFGTSNEKGPLHSTAVEFDLKLSILEQKWEKLCSHNVFTWFKKKVAPVIRENMREELLHSLGIDDDKYTQNNSESLNALVKCFVSFKNQDLATFVSDLEECVLEQQNEVEKSIIGLGGWKLSEQYSYMRKKADTWFTAMSMDDKIDAVYSLHQAILRSCQKITSHPLPHPMPNPNSPVSTPHSGFTSHLSIPHSYLSGVLSTGELTSIWSKSERLLSEGKVVKAPASSRVASDSTASPHVVMTLPSSKHDYICDKQCVGWKTRNICAHTVAVASDNNELKEFLEWYCSSKVKSNLTTAAYHGTYKHAGQKKTQRKKYGNAVHVPSSEKLDRIPLTDFSNIQKLMYTMIIHMLSSVKELSQLTVVSDSTVSLTNDVQHTTVNSNVHCKNKFVILTKKIC